MNIFSFIGTTFGYIKGNQNNMVLMRDQNTEKSLKANDLEFNRANTKFLNTNNEIVASLRLTMERGVVGANINIQSRTKNAEFNKEFESLIKEWAKLGNCEVTGRFHLGLAERTMIGTRFVQGGIIIRHHYNKKWDFGYKFELVPLHMVDVSKGTYKGIEVDEFGAITDIWLYSNPQKTASSKVSYKDLTLYVIPTDDVTQYSGLPTITPILTVLSRINEYTEAELQSATNKANNAIFIKSGIYESIMKAVTSIFNKTPSTDNVNADIDAFEKTKIKGMPNGVKYIPRNDDVTQLTNQSDTIFADLTTISGRTLSSGIGLSSQATLREVVANYTASLYNAQLDEGTFSIEADNLVEIVLRDMIENRLLKALMLKGLLNYDDFWYNPSSYKNVVFIRKVMSHIDPVKVANSNEKDISTGIRSEIDMIAEDGRDYEDVIRERITYKLREQEIAKEMGYEMPQNQTKDTTNANP